MKKGLKNIFLAIAFLLVLPFGMFAKVTHILFKTTQFFDFFSQLFALIPGIPGTLMRACFYKQTLKKCSIDIFVSFCSVISKIDSEIGKGVKIGGHTQIGRVKIGDNCGIANFVSILSGRYQHNFTDPNQEIFNKVDDSFVYLTIGENTFIGDNSTVMADIGDCSIIGAASNVLKPIPPYVVAVGNPCKVIKQRTMPETIKDKHVSKEANS